MFRYYLVLKSILGRIEKVIFRNQSDYLGKKKEIIDRLRIKGMKIGKNVNIINTIFDSNFPFLIEIGNNCTLTYATVLAHDASLKVFLGKVKVGKVIIGNNCFIGAGSIILPNTRIGDNTIIGAGSVVSRDIPSGSVAAGVPAKVIYSIDEFTKRCEEGGFLVGKNFPNIPSLKQVDDVINEVRELNRLGKFDR
jgi:maltose O-acetyltransferase